MQNYELVYNFIDAHYELLYSFIDAHYEFIVFKGADYEWTLTAFYLLELSFFLELSAIDSINFLIIVYINSSPYK